MARSTARKNQNNPAVENAVNRMRPIHPGEILLHDYLEPLGISANKLAISLAVPAVRINDIIRGRRAITADTALRLGTYFGSKQSRFEHAQTWMNLQSTYDLKIKEQEDGANIIRNVRAPER